MIFLLPKIFTSQDSCATEAQEQPQLRATSTRPVTALNATPRAGAGNTWTPGHTREQDANERQVSHSKDTGATLPNEDGTPRIYRP